MIAELYRNYETDATIGTFVLGGRVLCFILELQYRGNRKNVSCIPPDTYICKRVESPRFGETFEVTDVYGRTHILFHVANTADELEGCLATGLSVGYINGKRAVIDSRKAFDLFMNDLIGIDEFKLIIH